MAETWRKLKEWPELILERIEDAGVARIVLNRPDKRNCWNRALCLAFLDALEIIRADRELKVVITKGAGTVYSSGLDLNFLLRGGLERHQRIARHLWRMCAALAIAAFSFFLGQQDEFPAAWRGLAIWFVPPFAVLAAMAFWLVRVRFGAAFGRPAADRRSAYQS